MIDSAKVKELREEIQKKRHYGVIHFDIRPINQFPRENRHVTLNANVESLAFHSLEDQWLTIGDLQAFQIISGVLFLDMAFSLEIMTLREATELALEVLDMLPGHTYCFTHETIFGDVHGRTALTPLTDATFNTGVAFMNTEQIGIFWVDDED